MKPYACRHIGHTGKTLGGEKNTFASIWGERFNPKAKAYDHNLIRGETGFVCINIINGSDLELSVRDARVMAKMILEACDVAEELDALGDEAFAKDEETE